MDAWDRRNPTVFPTGVGVDRGQRLSVAYVGVFSPQAWGWTARILYHYASEHVFPTGVGVDRANARPRMRG